MSMTLNRFRIQGGFLQLVQILETTEPAKRKNLLHLVGTEDPGWAHLLRIKCLTLEKIFSWPKEVLQPILLQVTDPALACLHSALPAQLRPKLLFSISQTRMADLIQAISIHKATANEEFAATVRVIQIVREFEAQKKLDFALFDPTLIIDEKLAS